MGADYKKAARMIQSGSMQAAQAANLTRYYPVCGGPAGINNGVWRARLPRTIIAMRLRVFLNNFPGAGEQIAVTLYEAAAGTTLTVVITNANTEGDDYVNVPVIAENSYWQIEAVTSLNCNATIATWCFEYR